MPDGDPVKRTRIAYETAKKEYERAAKLEAVWDEGRQARKDSDGHRRACRPQQRR